VCIVSPELPPLAALTARLEAAMSLPDTVPDRDWLIARAKRAVRRHISPPPLKPISWPEVLAFPSGALLSEPQPEPPLPDPDAEKVVPLIWYRFFRDR
jgi:hypothetical protein